MSFNLTAALRLKDAGFTSGVERATRSLNRMKSASSDIIKHLGLVTTAAAGVGLAFSSAKKAMDFEEQMSSIKALTGMSNSEMQSMSNLAIQAGAKTKYSALEASQAIEELAKAGMSTATIKAGGLEAALNLATAGGMNLADSASLMANSLNGFREDGLKAAQVADILAGAANASAADMIDLKYGLAAVGPVSAGIGMSLKDTSAAIALFSNHSLSGSDAGTSFKTMLMGLQPQTKKQVGLMRDLGIITKDGTNRFFDAQGKVKGLAGVADVLRTSLDKLNPKERAAALRELFGSDAIRAGNILFQAGAKGVKEMYAEMGKVTVLEVAREKMNNAKGAVEQFKGALETLQIAVLTPLMPVIKDAANRVAGFIAKLSPKDIQAFGEKVKTAFQTALDLATGVYNFITQNWPLIRETIVGVTTAVVAFKAGMMVLTIVQTITQLINGFRAAMAAAAVGQWAMNTAMWACPATWIVAAIAAVIAIGVLLYRNWDTVKSKAVALWNKMGFLKSIILALLGPIGALIKAGVYLYKNWDKVKAKMDSVWEGIKRAAAKAVNFIIDGINGMIRMINKIPGVNIPIVPKVDWGQSGINPPRIIRAGGALDAPDRMSHHGGISRVPYDGYSANLHKGERVLTKVEADAYQRGGNGGVTLNISSININGGPTDRHTARKLIEVIADEIEQAGMAGA